ncbi:MAG: Uncharacterised protein [Prochlorococcus marinus str. MIT 9215]|nr:MAG: Uncharacterised protein [Prochlorococcus marinus str. MIT 9215]
MDLYSPLHERGHFALVLALPLSQDSGDQLVSTPCVEKPQMHTIKPSCTKLQGQLRDKHLRPFPATESKAAAAAWNCP